LGGRNKNDACYVTGITFGFNNAEMPHSASTILTTPFPCQHIISVVVSCAMPAGHQQARSNRPVAAPQSDTDHRGGINMETDKKHAKACCSMAHDKLKAHLNYCDSPSRTEEQKHHCYRYAAWQSGRRAKKCMTTS
jgi:hypothetical protein